MYKNSLALPISFLFFFSQALSAAEVGEIQWHGFLTSAYLVTSGAGENVEYAEGVSDQGGLKDSRFGLNFNVLIDSGWTLAAQFEALGEEDFEMELDWAFVKHSLSNHSHLRFGKVKHPTGIVNDYADVGYNYLWIRPPDVFYNKATHGPNISYFAYTGASATLGTKLANVVYSMDLHFGESDLSDGHAKQWSGVKFQANYQEEVRFQVGINSGIMELENSPRSATMNEKRMTTSYAGLAVDTERFIFYTEAAYADHETMDIESAYATVGIPLADATTSLSFERWSTSTGWGQSSVGLGLRIAASVNSVLKLEIKRITPESGNNLVGGRGLFEGVPENDTVDLFGMALDVVF